MYFEHTMNKICIKQRAAAAIYLKHAIIEDGGLPPSLGILFVVSQTPDVPATTIALQVQQHYGLHTAWNAHWLPLAVNSLHLH